MRTIKNYDERPEVVQLITNVKNNALVLKEALERLIDSGKLAHQQTIKDLDSLIGTLWVRLGPFAAIEAENSVFCSYEFTEFSYHVRLKFLVNNTIKHLIMKTDTLIGVEEYFRVCYGIVRPCKNKMVKMNKVDLAT